MAPFFRWPTVGCLYVGQVTSGRHTSQVEMRQHQLKQVRKYGVLFNGSIVMELGGLAVIVKALFGNESADMLTTLIRCVCKGVPGRVYRRWQWSVQLDTPRVLL